MITKISVDFSKYCLDLHNALNNSSCDSRDRVEVWNRGPTIYNHLKWDRIFSYATFYFWNSGVFLAIIATIDFSRPQTPDFPKKKLHKRILYQWIRNGITSVKK